jgi:chromate transporter
VTRVRLARLARVFAWTGLTSIGGGRYAFFYEALVVRRPWVRNDEFVQDLTLSQLLPGPTFSNLAVALGARLGGWAGAFWGVVALVLPGALILLGVSAIYFKTGFTPAVAHAMRGMSAAVVGLVLVATLTIAPASLRSVRAIAIAAAVFLLVGPLGVNAALAIAVIAPASIWLHRPRRPAP